MKRDDAEMKKRVKTPELRVWGHDIFTFDELIKKDVIVFKTVKGTLVPLSPWPVRFFISRDLLEYDMAEVQPLTFTRLIRSIVQNFMTINWWRIKMVLYKVGFLEVKNFGEMLSIREHWRWDIRCVRKERETLNKLHRASNVAENIVSKLDTILKAKHGVKKSGKNTDKKGTDGVR